MKKRKGYSWQRHYIHQQGNVLLITAILILILSIIVATTVNIANVEANLSDLARDTSNTYTIATDGIEKHVETINKGLQLELPNMIQDLGEKNIQQLASGDPSTSYSNIKYNTSDSKLKIADCTDGLKETIQDGIYEYLQDYIDQSYTYEVQSDRKEQNYKTFVTITTESIPDPADPSGATPVKDKVLVTAEAVSKKSASDTEFFDKESAQAIVSVDLSASLKDEIREYYKWRDQEHPSELMTNTLVCFSDVIIDGVESDGTHHKLTLGENATGKTADAIVKGTEQSNLTGGITDATNNGGVIVKNGGQLQVYGNLYCDKNVVATNGWRKKTVSGTTECDTTAYGIGGTQIDVTGDVIANTLCITDDYYNSSLNQLPTTNKVSSININVGKNVIVDNDATIERFVHDSNITVTGTIFGISNGTDTKSVTGSTWETGGSPISKTVSVNDPNSSSGVFCQGQNSCITANGILVAGQPYVILNKNSWPLKLFESIGEPFDAVQDIPAYKNNSGSEGNASIGDVNNYSTNGINADLYLKNDSPYYNLVTGDKIQTHLKYSSAVERMSFTNTDTTPATTMIGYDPATGSPSPMMNKTALLKFLFQGNDTTTKLSTNTNVGWTAYDADATDSFFVQDDLRKYFQGVSTEKVANNYHRNLFSDIMDTAYDTLRQSILDVNGGVKGYSIARRSILYRGFKAVGTSDWELVRNKFEDVIDLSKLSMTSHSWEYETPIIVYNGSSDVTYDIDDFFVANDIKYEKDFDASKDVENVSSGSYPTIIINRSSKKLTLKSGTKHEFNGVIISKGPVELKGNMTINGSIIIGGPEISSADESAIFTEHQNAGLIINGDVTIKKDNDMLLKVESRDRALYRSVLEALKLVQYSKYDEGASTPILLADVLAPYKDDKLEYIDVGSTKKGVLMFSSRSYLQIDTKDVKLKIDTLKKVQ